MPVRQIKTVPTSRPNESRGAEYVFPQRIVLDDVSWQTFCSEMENPRPPNAALRALFKK